MRRRESSPVREGAGSNENTREMGRRERKRTLIFTQKKKTLAINDLINKG